ncbi:MAG: hypothetical protein WCS71_08810 [Sphaerochaetaceae bacterium]
MGTNSLNVHVFGSDNDALYLGAQGIDLSAMTLTSEIPAEMIECGWLSDDGSTLGMKDSTKAIQGHQGHANVLTFMDSSDTTLEATLLESKLQTFLWNLDATAEQISASGDAAAYTKITAKASRRVINLCAIWDTFDTLHDDVKWRYVFPLVSLGERDEIPFKAGEITAYKFALNVLGDFVITTDAEGMQLPSAPVVP